MKLEKWASILVLMIFFVLVNTGVAKAAETSLLENQSKNLLNKSTTTTKTYLNPLYKDLDITPINNSTINTFSTLSGTGVHNFTTVEKASNYLRQEMIKRNTTITFKVNTSDYENIDTDIYNLATAYDDERNSSEGDYLKLNLSGYSCSTSYSSGYVSLTYTMFYLDTYTQEQKVDAKVKNVLDNLNVYNSDEYTKIKAVHDYIVKNIEYDYSLSNRSAYNAIIDKNVVCQGFASLTYKMLKELGVGVRIITGVADGGAHAWNIVCISGKWYNIDNTWDENLSDTNDISNGYFLKNNKSFSDHIRGYEYSTASFNKKYPMAVESLTSDFEFDASTGTITKYISHQSEVVIPSEINGVPVKNIGENAFALRINLTNITIPNGITSIGDHAFDNCSNLKSVTIPNSVTNIGYAAFFGCTSLTNITIPNSVTGIGNSAFGYCSSLKSVKISNSVKSIGMSTFKNCSSLISIIIPNSVTSIGYGVFEDCSSLTSIIIPNSVTSIGYGAFKNCNSLKSIAIPNGVITIEYYAFENCSNLTSITIPNSVKNIRQTTFLNCKKAIFYVENEPMKELLIKSGIDKNKIVIGSLKEVEEVKLSKTSLSIVKGDTSTLTATITPADATNKTVTWKSNNAKVATVDSNGKVTGVGAGSATITCTASDGSLKYAKCVVTVANPVKVTSISLSKTSLSVVKGYTSILTATILPSNATNKGVTWKSSNTAIATVDASGKVTGVGVGTATVTCTAKDGSGKYAVCKVTVTNPIKIISITLNRTSLSVVKGYTSTLTPTISPSNATNKGVTWKSSNTAIATVDANGKVTGVAAGSVIITSTAKDGSGKYATCKVTVTNAIKVTSIALNKTSLSLVKGYSPTLIRTVLPNNATNKGVTWKSSNVAVAIVDSNGKVTGLGVGTATITCTAKDGSGKLATCKVTVTNPTKVTLITLNKTRLSLAKGKISTLTATVSPNNATNKAVTWSSSNTKIATVDSNGKVTGIGAGSANITCTTKDGSGKSATCKLTVTK